MAQLGRAANAADISSKIYTNQTRLIKGNTVKGRLLNLNDSLLNIISDLNTNGGYLGIDANGIVNTSFIRAAAPTGKFLKDDGSWDEPVSGSALTATQVGVGSALNMLGGTAHLTFDPGISGGNIQRLTIGAIGPQIDMYGSAGGARIETNGDMYLTLFTARDFVFKPGSVESLRLTSTNKTLIKDSGRTIQLGGRIGVESLYGALYFADTPTGMNYALAGNDTTTFLNASGSVTIQNNNSNQLVIAGGTSLFNTHIVANSASITAGIGAGVSNAWFSLGPSTTSRAQMLLYSGVSNASIAAPVSGMINNDGTDLWAYLSGAWQKLNNSGYVPYTGATSTLALGNNNLTLFASGTANGYVELGRNAASSAIGSPAKGVRLASNSVGNLLMTTCLDSYVRSFTGVLTGTRSYTLPNASGTIALTNTITLANVLTNGNETGGEPIYFTNDTDYWVYADSSTPGQVQFLAYNLNTGYNSGINQNTTGLNFFVQDWYGYTSLLLNGGSMQVQGSSAGFAGITYNGDYSANYNARSLVDKGYVTSKFVPMADRDYYKITEGTTIIIPSFGSNQTLFGCEVSTYGTITTPAPANTNFQTQKRRTTFTSTAAPGSFAGQTTSAANWWNGDTDGFGGFYIDHEFTISSNATGMKAFIGLTTTAGNLTGNPTAYVNYIGIGFNSSDSAAGNWYYLANDNAAAGYVQDLGSDAARNTTDVFRLIIYCVPNTTDMLVKLYNLSTGVGVLDAHFITNIPVGKFLYYKMEMGTGTLSTAVQIENIRLTIRN